MWQVIDDPVEKKSMPEPACSSARGIRRLPAWMIWGSVIGLVQIFAIATVGPLGVSTAYPQFSAGCSISSCPASRPASHTW